MTVGNKICKVSVYNGKDNVKLYLGFAIALGMGKLLKFPSCISSIVYHENGLSFLL